MASVSLDQEVYRADVDVCSVCLREKTDARLLPCLHSFCRKCIDQEAVAADSVYHRLRCPVCRAECSLPVRGASGLLRDATICGAEETLDCQVCKEHRRNGRPNVWCANCQTALCKEHVLSHVGSSPGPHNIQPLGEPDEGKTSVTRLGAALCADHAQPLTLFCVQCDVAICGHCCAVGRHKTHQPVLLVEEVIAQKKEAITSKARKLQRDFLPPLQTSAQDINTVKTQLGNQADKVRDQIETARQQAVDSIEAYAKQLLQDVDDIEMQRTKLLESQLCELKRLTEGVTTAVRFSQELEKSNTTLEETVALLAALDSRLSAFVSSEREFSGKPSAHPHMTFGVGSTDTLFYQGPEIMGRVKACNVSVAHSCVEGCPTRRSSPNKPFTFTIITKDENGDPLTNGGHRLTAKFLNRPAAHTAEAPNVEVTDENNGQYRLSFVTPHVGQYSVEVYINGTKMAQVLTLVSMVPDLRCRRFDLAEWQSGITLSEDRQTATNVGLFPESVLGEQGASCGEMSWKLSVRCHSNYGHYIGVAPKPGLTAANDNYDRVYGWHGCMGDVQFQGVIIKRGVGRLWSKGDVVELKLDCDDHTLRLTNTHTGKTAIIANLPDEELFPYCSLFEHRASMSFVD